MFWRATVLPLAGRIANALTQWLAPSFGAGLALAVDTDRIEALSADRAALWERVTKAPFLTVNEKRAATGYGRSRAAMSLGEADDARLIDTFTARGDLAHLALLMWALSASALAWFALARTDGGEPAL